MILFEATSTISYQAYDGYLWAIIYGVMTALLIIGVKKVFDWIL